jgi:hypothetical protein
MINLPTKGKSSLRERYRALEKFCNTLRMNSENATIVANAMFWKHGYGHRDAIKAVVDEYMQHMQEKILAAKAATHKTVIDGFVDQTLLDKVKEFTDDSSYVEPENA